MEKEYIFGYLPSEADKMTLDEIYTYLINKGVIDNTVSKNDLAVILEGVIKSITPDMIRGNVTIAGVTGNVATKVEEVYVDKFDEVEIPEKEISHEIDPNYITYDQCNYKYVSSNGIDAYGVCYHNDTPGVYYKNLTTGYTKRIESTAYNLDRCMYCPNGVVLLYSSRSYCRGLYVCSGTTVSIILKEKYYDVEIKNFGVDGTYACLENKTSTYRVDTGNPTIVLNDRILGTYTSNNGTRYITGVYGMYTLTNGVFTKINDARIKTLSVYETSTGDLYFMDGGASSPYYGILYKSNTDNNFTQIYSSGYNYTVFYSNDEGGIYISSNTKYVPGILYVLKNSVTVLCDTGYSWRCAIEDELGVYLWGYSVLTGIGIHLHNTDTFELRYENFAGSYPFLDINGNIYIFSTNSTVRGTICIIDGNPMLIDTLCYVSYNTTSAFNTPNGDLYLADTTYLKGLYYLCDGQIYTLSTTNGWTYKTTIASDTYIHGKSGLMYLNGTQSTLISESNYNGKGITYISSTGVAVLYWGSSSYPGIYILDKSNTSLISSTLYSVKTFEDSHGGIYLFASSQYLYVYDNSLLYTFTPAYAHSISYIYETPTGKILLSSSSIMKDCLCSFIYDGKLYALSGNTYGVSILTTEHYTYYCRGNSTYINYGIVAVDNTDNTIEIVVLPYPTYTYKFYGNKIFIVSYTDGEGIAYVENLNATIIYTIGFMWNIIAIDLQNNIYLSSGSSTYNYILKIDNSLNVEQIYTGIYGLFLSYVTTSGVIILCPALNSAAKNLCIIKDSVFTKTNVYINGNCAFYEASNGDVYITKIDNECIAYVKNDYVTAKTLKLIDERYYGEYYTISYECSPTMLYMSCAPNQYGHRDSHTYLIKDYVLTKLPIEYKGLTNAVHHNGSVYLTTPSTGRFAESDGVYGREGIAYINGDYYKKLHLGYNWQNVVFNDTEFLTCREIGARSPGNSFGQPKGSTYILDKEATVFHVPFIIPFENSIHVYNNIYLFYTYVKDSNSHHEYTYYINFDTGVYLTVCFLQPMDFYEIKLLPNNDIIFLQYEDTLYTGIGLYIIHNDTVYTTTDEYKEALNEQRA